MRQSGFGIFYDYDDIPAGQRRFSADGTLVAAFWVRRHKEDRYDEDTIYGIAVWDAATKKQVESYTHIHAINRQSGEVDGQPLKDLRWERDGRLWLVFTDGSAEPAAPEIDPVPPWIRRQQQR